MSLTTDESQRKTAWAAWLDKTLTDRALRNRDLARLLKEAGAGTRYTNTSLISQWRGGTAGASETAALFIAKALALPGPYVLRQAGHHDAARLIEEEPRTPAPTDEARRRAETLKKDIDELVRLAEIGRAVTAEREHAAHDESRDAS